MLTAYTLYVILFLLIGAVAGFIAGICFAPKEGSQTRREAKEKYGWSAKKDGDIEIDIDADKEFKKICSMQNKLDKKKYVDELYSKKSKKQNYVKKTYLTNYGEHINEDDFHLDIRLLDGTDYRDMNMQE